MVCFPRALKSPLRRGTGGREHETPQRGFRRGRGRERGRRLRFLPRGVRARVRRSHQRRAAVLGGTHRAAVDASPPPCPCPSQAEPPRAAQLRPQAALAAFNGSVFFKVFAFVPRLRLWVAVLPAQRGCLGPAHRLLAGGSELLKEGPRGPQLRTHVLSENRWLQGRVEGP